jgi:hypothetical protein
MDLGNGASASVLSDPLSMYDNFSQDASGAPSSSLWIYSSAALTGSVAYVYNANAWSNITSTSSYAFGTQQGYEFQLEGSGGPWYMGLSDGAGGDTAWMTFGGDSYSLIVNYAAAATFTTAPAPGDVLDLVRTATGWQAYDNGNLEAQVTDPGGTPLATLGHLVMTTGPDDGVSVGYVGIRTTVTPEPSALLLLGIGLFSLLAYAWRKRK